MRKLALAAITTIAFVGSSFASNEVVIEDREVTTENQMMPLEGLSFEDDACVSCTITITKYNSDGSIKSSETKNYRTCTMTCDQAVEQVNTFFATGKIIAPSKIGRASCRE